MTQSAESEILQRLARIEEKLDTHESHEVRIRAVERWQAVLAGIVALVAIELQIAGVVIAVMKL
jgi:hypothetical protein